MIEFIEKFPIIWVAVMTLIGFLAMGIDKFKAVRGHWRIPEKTLFLLCILGGSIGTIAGMRAFRHKTRKPIFSIGMPVIFAVQIAIIGYLKLGI